jgi:hypothetical protein
LPAGLFEPAGGDALAEFAEFVGGFGHAGESTSASPGSVTETAAAGIERFPAATRAPHLSPVAVPAVPSRPTTARTPICDEAPSFLVLSYSGIFIP